MRSPVRFVLLLVPCLVVGCATDPRDSLIRNTIAKLNQAANEIDTITEKVDKSIAKAENSKLAPSELAEVKTSIENLKTLSQDLQKLKQGAEQSGGSLTAEERAALRTEHQGRLNSAMEGIEKARSGLQKKLIEAEAKDPETTKDLRSKISEVEGFYVSLSRQH